jgi:cytochrome c biogenesis protein CcmG, thiol:disulfide interchange protein DsbE
MSSSSRRPPRSTSRSPRSTRPPGSRRSPARSERPAGPGRSAGGGPSRRSLLVVAGVVAVVLVALVVALVAGSGDGDDIVTDGGSTGGQEVAGPFTAADVPEDTPATVTGDALPPLPDDGDDPAVGRPVPTLSGTGLDGEPLTIPTGGRPTMVVFLAHWCPHCRAEVGVVQDWIDEGGLPSGVDLVAVSTAADDRRPNFPPAAWLDGEGWTAPVLVDGDDAAARAVGLTAFPFFVAVDGQGDVVRRTSGELSTDALTGIAAELVATAS